MNLTLTIPPICFWPFPLMVDRTFGALLDSVWAFIPFYTRCKQALKRLVLSKKNLWIQAQRFRAFTRVDIKPQKTSAGPSTLDPCT